MTRRWLAFTILALGGVVLTLPDPSVARPSFRPAFTGGPFRIVVPQGRPHFHGGPRIGKPIGKPIAKPVAPGIPHAIGAHPSLRTVTAGAAPFRMHRRHVRGSLYPVTTYSDGAYYGTPYDPSDSPVYAPLAVDDAPGPVMAMPVPAPQPRGCRADQVIVPNGNRPGESQITIVRC